MILGSNASNLANVKRRRTRPDRQYFDRHPPILQEYARWQERNEESVHKFCQYLDLHTLEPCPDLTLRIAAYTGVSKIYQDVAVLSVALCDQDLI